MSFPFSHIPANLTKVVFAGPYSHVPVNIGAVDEPCISQWEYRFGHDVDFNRWTAWTPLSSDAIDFNFTCETDPEPCNSWWTVYPGNVVPLAFSKPWESYQGNQVPITFECETGGGGVSYTYFTGYLDATDGAWVDFDFATSYILGFYDGAVASTDLETSPSLSIGLMNVYEGASGAASLATTHAFTFNAYEGASASLILATDTTLDEIPFWSDAVMSAVLTDNPPFQILPLFYDGAAGELTLSTSVTYAPLFFEGAYATVDLLTAPAPDLLFEAFEGAAASTVLSVSLSLATVNQYDGAHATLVSLDSDQFWRMYEGASSSVALATDTTLPQAGYNGEIMEFDLYIRPSEGMGTFRAYEGARTDIVVQTLVAVYLYPNRISAGFEYTCEFDISTSFDLNNTACCPIKDTYERIELTDGPAVNEYYHGDKWVMTCDLSTRPRFSMSFHSGENFQGIDPITLGPFNFYDGDQWQLSHLNFEEVNFKLCYGNFIPDGDFVNTELVNTYAEDCEADFFYEGAYTDIFLENNVQFQIEPRCGELMQFDIYIEPIMLLLAYSGEFVRVSNPEFSPHAYEGAEVSAQFEEFAWRFYSGETMEVPKLTTEYDVEFLEVGCLDNEYVPSNENGDPDWENFNPVPVELDRYVHSIKARCF